jgi:hypothetical protein
MKPHNADFWFELQVNPNEMSVKYARDKEEFVERLGTSELMTEKTLETLKSLTGCNSISELASKDSELLKEVWCLWKFYNNRRRKHLISMYTRKLPASTLKRNFSSEKDFEDVFKCLLLLLFQRDDLLKEFLLMDTLEITGLQKMELTHESGNLRDFREFKGDLEETMRSLLPEFEGNMNEHKESYLERIVYESNQPILFVRRERKQQIITQPKDSVLVKPAERIIIAIVDGGRIVEIAARTKNAGTSLVNMFAKRLFGSGYSYGKVVSKNDEGSIIRFLEKVVTARDQKLPIVRLELEQSPLEGSPSMTLAHEETLIPSIKELRNKRIDVFEDMASIRKLTVLFQGKKIDLRITKTGEKTYDVSYSDNKLVLNDRAEFERRMKDDWNFIRPKG